MTSKRFNLFLIGFLFQGILFAQAYISKTLEYEGETREFELYVPALYDGTSKVPLVFNFHGGNGDIASQIAIADMSQLAEVDNFIAVYPQALKDPNDGGSTNWLHKDPTSVDDIFFIDALIDHLDIDYEIDLSRIYACGYSLGGEFTYELACRLSHRIAAIGVVARTMQAWTIDDCAPMHPMGVLTILGTDDSISNYEGVFFGGIQYYLSADEMHDFWIEANRCEEVPEISEVPNIDASDGSTVERYTWSDFENCQFVEQLKVIGGGHDWPGSFGNMDIDATEEIWNFVSSYDLNGLRGCTSIVLNNQNVSQTATKVYPNPFVDQLTIEANQTTIKEVKMYSTLGDLVAASKLDADITTIDLSSLSSGVYFVSFENRILKVIKAE